MMFVDRHPVLACAPPPWMPLPASRTNSRDPRPPARDAHHRAHRFRLLPRRWGECRPYAWSGEEQHTQGTQRRRDGRGFGRGQEDRQGVPPVLRVHLPDAKKLVQHPPGGCRGSSRIQGRRRDGLCLNRENDRYIVTSLGAQSHPAFTRSSTVPGAMRKIV